MMMQRLGFLSSLHKLDGVFDDITMNSIQSFQVFIMSTHYFLLTTGCAQ